VTSFFGKDNNLFSDSLPGGTVRKMMIGAAITISIGFGIAFSSLYVVHSRTDYMSQASKDSLKGLAAINHLNFELKAISSKKKNALELRDNLRSSIESCGDVLMRVTEPTTPLAVDLESKRLKIRNLWKNLTDELQKAVVYLDNASKIEDHREITLYGVDSFLDHYDHSQRGVIGNSLLFAELRDFKQQITIIEHTADLFLKYSQQFSDATDKRHGAYLKTSQRISFAIFTIVTIFTIVFFTLYSGTLTRKLQTMVREIGKQNRELNEKDEELRAIMAAAPDLMFVLDSKGRYLEIFAGNPRLFIASEENLIGKTIHEALPVKVAQILQKMIDKTCETRVVQGCEYELTIDDKPCSFAARLVPFVHHDTPSILCLSRDTTEQKKMEREKEDMKSNMRHSQKMEAIGQLAGGIAHDFNNILSGIFGYSQLAQTHLQDPERANRDIEQIFKGAKRAADLVQQILTFSRKTEYQKHPLKIYTTVNEALNLLRASIPSTIEIVIKLDSKSLIYADPIRIHQIVMNLCTNSYHAMRKTGGSLTVSLTEVDVLESKSLWDKEIIPGKYLKLEISDTGIGMDKHELDKAFEPYFTTKGHGEGTGLGLALVHAIVDEHDSFLDIYSKPGKGTSFSIYFPIIKAIVYDDGLKAPKEYQASRNERIMVVDDEESIRESCCAFLQDQGYQVETFSNGVDALKIIKIDSRKFDLIITDMTMPELTGDRFAEEILKIQPQMPIILCTGYSDTMTETKAKTLGIRKFIQKPILNQDLVVMIRKILNKDSIV